MENTEKADAIIVVGPFLWKCVNCDILMSRKHSIDHHLFHSHHSKLHPNDLDTTTEDDAMIINCQLSLCNCHKLPKNKKKQQHTLKQKQHNVGTFKEPAPKKSKKLSTRGRSTPLSSPKEGIDAAIDDEEEERERMDEPIEDNDSGLSNENVAKATDDDDNDNSNPDPDDNKETEIEDRGSGTSSATLITVQVRGGVVPVEDSSSKIGKNSSGDSPASKDIKLEAETIVDLYVMKSKKKKEKEESDYKGDNNGALRKSKRSTKGHNSHFKEYETEIS